VPVSSTAAAFVVSLRTKLLARSGLSGVNVYLVAPVDTDQAEFILLLRGRVSGEQDWAALGRLRREDSYSIPCLIRVRKTIGTADEQTIFQSAMDRAAALLDEVVLQVRDSPPAVGDQTVEARVAEIVYVPLVEPEAWLVDCEFNVAYRARVS
jgi:hypothetical protein